MLKTARYLRAFILKKSNLFKIILALFLTSLSSHKVIAEDCSILNKILNNEPDKLDEPTLINELYLLDWNNEGFKTCKKVIKHDKTFKDNQLYLLVCNDKRFLSWPSFSWESERESQFVPPYYILTNEGNIVEYDYVSNRTGKNTNYCFTKEDKFVVKTEDEDLFEIESISIRLRFKKIQFSEYNLRKHTKIPLF